MHAYRDQMSAAWSVTVHPILWLSSSDPVQAFLVCEKILCEISTKDIPVSLLMPYYTFNMCYPKGCSNFYTFIEAGVFNMSIKNIPHTVEGLLTRLNALKQYLLKTFVERF